MRPEDYPPQEPFGEVAARYHAEVMRRGEVIEGEERAYGPDPYQSLTIHPAERPSGLVLAFWHGGGWTNGYKEWMAFMAPPLAARGVTLVSLGYRLAPRHVFPACFEDAADGFAAAREAVAAFGGDPDMMFVGGHSAGGHLSALLASRRDWRASRGLPAEPIRGTLPVSGIFRFRDGAGLPKRPAFLGPEGVGAEEAAEPESYLRPGLPPTFLAWGARDLPHVLLHCEAYAEALRASGNAVQTLVLAERDHLGASYATAEPEAPWLDRALGFMERHAG